MTADDVAILILRLGVGGIYLYAAYQNTRFFKSYTVPETALLFKHSSLAQNQAFIKLAAAVGLAVMYSGAGLIVLGVVARAGAILLAVFTAMGWLIYRQRWLEAQEYASTAPPEADPHGVAMGWSAYSGHFSSALKNLALICACLTIAVCGPKGLSLAQDWF
jgi:uncharacterized membrane protein YphA (DoxX/SURF4 family)